MNIVNIHNHHYQVHSPELFHVLKQFFATAEQRNQKLKELIEAFQSVAGSAKHHPLLQELLTQSEEAEIDIELVKKLLP